jgi:hypothetical protein
MKTGSFAAHIPDGLNNSGCYIYIYIYIHIYSSVICQTAGPQPLPKRFLHLMRSRASSFKWEYRRLSPRSSSNCLRLLPRLLVTSIRPFIFPSITSFRRQWARYAAAYTRWVPCLHLTRNTGHPRDFACSSDSYASGVIHLPLKQQWLFWEQVCRSVTWSVQCKQ